MQYADSKNLFDQLSEDFSRKCTTTSQPINYLKFCNNNGQINTDLDIQRGYQWDEKRQQEMWNSLLLNAHIPEFHALIRNDIYDIIDGKQRLLTIFKIINDEIPLKYSYAGPELHWIFAQGKNKDTLIRQINFSCLPKELQYRIYNTTILITTYSNLDRDEQIMLFKKINNGKALSDFAKGLCENFFIRKDGTAEMLKHSVFKNPEWKDEEQEAIEKALVRFMILKHKNMVVSLEPTKMISYYPEFDRDVLNLSVKQVNAVLDRTPTLHKILKCRAWESYFPAFLMVVDRHPELTAEQIDTMLVKIRSCTAGRGADLRSSVVAERISTVESLIDNSTK